MQFGKAAGGRQVISVFSPSLRSDFSSPMHNSKQNSAALITPSVISPLRGYRTTVAVPASVSFPLRKRAEMQTRRI